MVLGWFFLWKKSSHWRGGRTRLKPGGLLQKEKVGVLCDEDWTISSQMAESRSPKASPLSKTKAWPNWKSRGF